MNKQKPFDEPFDVTYDITFVGHTQADGVRTVTAQMIRDKLIAVLEDMLAKGFISEYHISAVLNNISKAHKVMRRMQKKTK